MVSRRQAPPRGPRHWPAQAAARRLPNLHWLLRSWWRRRRRRHQWATLHGGSKRLRWRRRRRPRVGRIASTVPVTYRDRSRGGGGERGGRRGQWPPLPLAPLLPVATAATVGRGAWHAPVRGVWGHFLDGSAAGGARGRSPLSAVTSRPAQPHSACCGARFSRRCRFLLHWGGGSHQLTEVYVV